ncbi:MAG: hypothetical protein PHO79_06940 [Desulfoplanes sp.]|nr:hypothetical protein [Desulfoplanes sp.]MDD4649732.1 hypothetical protein [Desulfoplanes sp.]
MKNSGYIPRDQRVATAEERKNDNKKEGSINVIGQGRKEKTAGGCCQRTRFYRKGIMGRE